MAGSLIDNNPSCQHCTHRNGSIFCKMEHDNMVEIDEEKECVNYKKGQSIFTEGNKPHGLYCVNKGKIKLVKMGEDGKEQILRLIKPGDLMGYRALLTGDRYNATAIALEDCGICFVPKHMFVNILQKDSNLTMEMMRILGEDLKKAEEHITHMAQKPVRERMAEALLFIKETYGFEPDNQTINVTLTREEMANLVGTATETAIRLLSEFKHDGIVELVGKKIKILNHPKLVSTANLPE
jgi:CRP/FNR family transcriptional regulator